MSCYSKHPDVDGIDCWHGPGHTGDHGKEHRSWPNLDDQLRKDNAAMLEIIRQLVDRPLGPALNDAREYLERVKREQSEREGRTG